MVKLNSSQVIIRVVVVIVIIVLALVRLLAF